MKKYQSDKPEEAPAASDVPPTRGDVIKAVREMLTRKKRDPSFATHFINEVCVHERPFEGPRRVSLIGGGGRYEYGYMERILNSLATYIHMSDKDRKILHGGNEDGVKWCGEPITQFIDVCNEHTLMLEMGVEKYRARFFKMAKGLGAKIVVEEKAAPDPIAADEAAFGRQGDYERRLERRRQGDPV